MVHWITWRYQMSQETKHRVNKAAFEQVLKTRNITQIELAEKIGAPHKSFSRWINEGFVYSKYLLDLSRVLDLSNDDMGRVLIKSTFNVYFRKKFLGNVAPEIKERAIELAKTFFRLTFLHEKASFCPPNTSFIAEPKAVADQIRKYTNITSFTDVRSMIRSLSQQGIEVGVVPFAQLGLTDGDLEQAFSVTDGKRCAIFLDSNCSEELLIFNLCHEMCHLFRPDVEITKAEESFCNEVAAELVYPQGYFNDRSEKIQQITSSDSAETIFNLVSNIQKDLGGEFFGVVLRLKKLGFLSDKNITHKKLFGLGKKISSELPKLNEKIFSEYNVADYTNMKKFWSSSVLDVDPLLRFYSHLKSGATDESLSPRKFSELLSVDISISDELIYEWRSSLRNRLEETPRG
jgi:hypothetical protein